MARARAIADNPRLATVRLNTCRIIKKLNQSFLTADSFQYEALKIEHEQPILYQHEY